MSETHVTVDIDQAAATLGLTRKDILDKIASSEIEWTTQNGQTKVIIPLASLPVHQAVVPAQQLEEAIVPAVESKKKKPPPKPRVPKRKPAPKPAPAPELPVKVAAATLTLAVTAQHLGFSVDKIKLAISRKWLEAVGDRVTVASIHEFQAKLARIRERKERAAAVAAKAKFSIRDEDIWGNSSLYFEP